MATGGALGRKPQARQENRPERRSSQPSRNRYRWSSGRKHSRGIRSGAKCRLYRETSTGKVNRWSRGRKTTATGGGESAQDSREGTGKDSYVGRVRSTAGSSQAAPGKPGRCKPFPRYHISQGDDMRKQIVPPDMRFAVVAWLIAAATCAAWMIA